MSDIKIPGGPKDVDVIDDVTEAADNAQAEEVIERQAQTFERLKPYLLKMWDKE